MFLQMCEYMAKAEPGAESEEAFQNHVTSLYKRSWEEIEHIRSKHEEWKLAVKKMRLGSQANNIHLRLGECEYDGSFTLKTSVGMRAAGGGVKLVNKELYEKTAAWFEKERAAGNFVDRVDLFLEWVHHAKELEAKLEDKALKASLALEDPWELTTLEEDQLSRVKKRLRSEAGPFYCSAQPSNPPPSPPRHTGIILNLFY